MIRAIDFVEKRNRFGILEGCLVGTHRARIRIRTSQIWVDRLSRQVEYACSKEHTVEDLVMRIWGWGVNGIC
jgi:hypothetical protein